MLSGPASLLAISVLKHAFYDRFVNCEEEEEEGVRGTVNSFQVIKAAIKVIQFIVKSSVGSGTILCRRLIVDYGLQTLPDILRVEILLKVVPVFGLTGLAGLFCCICMSLYASCFACSVCVVLCLI